MQEYGLKTNRELGVPCKATITIYKTEQRKEHILRNFEIFKGKPFDVFIPKMDFILKVEVAQEIRDWTYAQGARYTYLRLSNIEFNIENLNQPTCEIFNPSPEYYRMEHVIPPPPPFTCNYLNKQ